MNSSRTEESEIEAYYNMRTVNANKKNKAVPLHAMEAHGGEEVAPTHI
jgi:hypothetical protein